MRTPLWIIVVLLAGIFGMMALRREDRVVVTFPAVKTSEPEPNLEKAELATLRLVARSGAAKDGDLAFLALLEARAAQRRLDAIPRN